jgi:hypothetical protein
LKLANLGTLMPISEEQDPEKQRSQRERTPRRRGSKRADLVERAITSDVKATFADFIRLLQLQKELQLDEPREIKVTWIDPNETESASEE